MISQIQVIQHENLPHQYKYDQQNIRQLHNLSNSNKWVDSFNAITILRSIIKNQPETYQKLINEFIFFLEKQILQNRPLITKNLLLLFKQIFTTGKINNVQSIVQLFVPILIAKSVNIQGQISQLANLALFQFIKHCGSNTSFLVVIQNSFDKNPQICEVGLKMLAKMLLNIDSNIIHLQSSTLKQLMKLLFSFVDGKRMNLRSYSHEICKQNYLQLMQFSLTIQQGRKMLVHLNDLQIQQRKSTYSK